MTNMENRLNFAVAVAVSALAGFLLAAGPAKAGPDFTGVCPNVLGKGPFGGGGVGSATGCTIGVTIPTTGTTLTINTAASPGSTTGLVTSTAGSPEAYESIEDVLLGIVNTSSKTVSSITLTGANIFGFDGDGIDLYAGITPNSKDTSDGSYGGPIGWFSNINASNSTGTVHFIGGLAPGAATYFSLEEPIAGGISGVVGGAVPEPASLVLLGVGLAAIGVARPRKAR